MGDARKSRSKDKSVHHTRHRGTEKSRDYLNHRLTQKKYRKEQNRIDLAYQNIYLSG